MVRRRCVEHRGGLTACAPAPPHTHIEAQWKRTVRRASDVAASAGGVVAGAVLAAADTSPSRSARKQATDASVGVAHVATGAVLAARDSHTGKLVAKKATDVTDATKEVRV